MNIVDESTLQPEKMEFFQWSICNITQQVRKEQRTPFIIAELTARRFRHLAFLEHFEANFREYKTAVPIATPYFKKFLSTIQLQVSIVLTHFHSTLYPYPIRNLLPNSSNMSNWVNRKGAPKLMDSASNHRFYVRFARLA